MTGLGHGAELDLYPQALRLEIAAVNERVYDTVNNGVYRAGFARSQRAYEHAFAELSASTGSRGCSANAATCSASS